MEQGGHNFSWRGHKVSVCDSGITTGALLAAGALLTLSLFGCKSETISLQTTPKEFLSSYQKAVSARDYAVIRECLDPELGTSVTRLTSAHKAYAESGKQLGDLVREKFGTTMERHFHDRMYDTFDRLFDQVVLWDLPERHPECRIARFDAVSGRQRVLLGKMDTGILVMRSSAGWSVSFTRERDFEAEAPRLSAMYDELADSFALTIIGIRRGVVTQQNVAAILSGAQPPPGAEAPAPPVSEDLDFFEERVPSKP